MESEKKKKKGEEETREEFDGSTVSKRPFERDAEESLINQQ